MVYENLVNIEGGCLMTECVVVFTFRSVERILREEGTSAWRLDPFRARHCPYVVCTRNKYSAHGTEGDEPHGSAFLIGKIRDVILSPDPKEAANGRFLIRFHEYALIDVPKAWEGDRNPVKYRTLEKLHIDPAKLDWKPMPSAGTSEKRNEETASVDNLPRPLTIPEAKLGLARTFNVPPEAIEIIVRG
jgi:hypothetical protein